jgi:ferric-dicitrate binding protein FerR (iron transport regulator)
MRSSSERPAALATPQRNEMRRKNKLSPISMLIAAIALTIVAMAGTLGNYAEAATALSSQRSSV